jgi:hypothetical protein
MERNFFLLLHRRLSGTWWIEDTAYDSNVSSKCVYCSLAFRIPLPVAFFTYSAGKDRPGSTIKIRVEPAARLVYAKITSNTPSQGI